MVWDDLEPTQSGKLGELGTTCLYFLPERVWGNKRSPHRACDPSASRATLERQLTGTYEKLRVEMPRNSASREIHSLGVFNGVLRSMLYMAFFCSIILKKLQRFGKNKLKITFYKQEESVSEGPDYGDNLVSADVLCPCLHPCVGQSEMWIS